MGIDSDNQISSLYNDRANNTLVTQYWGPDGKNIECLTVQVAISNLNNGHFWPDLDNANDSISGYDFLGSGAGCQGWAADF